MLSLIHILQRIQNRFHPPGQSLHFRQTQRTECDADSFVDLDGVDMIVDQLLMILITQRVILHLQRYKETFFIRITKQTASGGFFDEALAALFQQIDICLLYTSRCV